MKLTLGQPTWVTQYLPDFREERSLAAVPSDLIQSTEIVKAVVALSLQTYR